MVFATSHVPTVHPLLAAKQSATIDNISAGRFGLNIVCGWFRPEIEMFGIVQLDHDARYRMADEWLTVMKIDGFILSWLDYAEELKYFGERVMPLLTQAGLRATGIDQGRIGLLHRLRQQEAALDLVELALVIEILLGPGALHHRQPFIGHAIARVVV